MNRLIAVGLFLACWLVKAEGGGMMPAITPIVHCTFDSATRQFKIYHPDASDKKHLQYNIPRTANVDGTGEAISTVEQVIGQFL